MRLDARNGIECCEFHTTRYNCAPTFAISPASPTSLNEFDANGNLVFDVDRNMQLHYNTRNLPLDIVFDEGLIRNTYRPDGLKTSKMVYDGKGRLTLNETYLGNLVLNFGVPSQILHPEGVVDVSNLSLPVVHYHLKDHLGNVRAVVNPSATNTALISQTNDYYPFGMCYTKMPGPYVNKRKYNGKEEQEMPGRWLDYGDRFYDLQLGRWHGVDPLADYRSWVSPYSYCQNNPLNRIDPTGALDGDFVSESGKYLGNDGILNDGKVYVIKTTQTTSNIYDKHENPKTSYAGITTSERNATESFITSNSGNTAAFQENDIAYRNSVEIVGDAGLRQGMVDIVNQDNGKGLSKPSNNREYGGNIKDGTIIPASPSAVGNVKSGNGILTIDLLSDSPSFHSHASGTYSPMVDFNSYGQAIETKFWYQSPSSTDIKNAGGHTNYVFGKGNGTVYIYNSQGVNATIPQKYFVNPQK